MAKLAERCEGSEVLSMTQRSTYRILLIDDDPNCLDAIDQILRRDGYETFAIGEGRGAVKIIMENSIDLAIVDVHLPDIDGLHVLYEIKRVRRDLPVMLMTAEPSKELRLASLEAGAYSFISKPINIPSFRRIVAKALESPRLKTMVVRRELVITRWIRGIINR
jgi:DNA-binding NtrC family response regulator